MSGQIQMRATRRGTYLYAGETGMNVIAYPPGAIRPGISLIRDKLSHSLYGLLYFSLPRRVASSHDRDSNYSKSP